MTNKEPISADAALVAIDIAKVRNEVLIEAPGQKRRRRLSVLNTRTEHDRFIETLIAMASRSSAPSRRPEIIIAPSPGG